MLHLITGQKAKLSDIGASDSLSLNANLTAGAHTFDIACFLLDANNKLIGDAYMVFYNQPATPCGGVTMTQDASTRFDIALARLPDTVAAIVLTLSMEDATVQALSDSRIEVVSGGQTRADYAFSGSDFGQERALMLMQLYKKQGIWRINAIGQGFHGGLAALVTHFGAEVADTAPVETPPSSAANNATDTTKQPPPSTPAKPLNLKKVILDKPGNQHRISLNKNDPAYLKVEAIWQDNGDNNSDNDDLDLRVGILAAGATDMDYVHAPMRIGSLTAKPYIQHQGDVQSASLKEPGKETVLVHPDIAKHYGGKVALVFSVYSAVSNGVVSIASLQPKMRMAYQDQVVECVFNPNASPKAKSRFVYTYVIGIAIIDEQGISLQHSGMTSRRMSEATPRLSWDKLEVQLHMDGKPMFKPKND
ncbi:TerD family protein [Psychrobacter aestuarii]|uniref:TerD domain-containing protein n=1 Tax=Psychrobacter aestuarii TaxID=556327 RepID=A0ABP3FME4_9GAMM|nr:TerD family protein [Psychrobacter aestuarii]